MNPFLQGAAASRATGSPGRAELSYLCGLCYCLLRGEEAEGEGSSQGAVSVQSCQLTAHHNPFDLPSPPGTAAKCSLYFLTLTRMGDLMVMVVEENLWETALAQCWVPGLTPLGLFQRGSRDLPSPSRTPGCSVQCLLLLPFLLQPRLLLESALLHSLRNCC